MMGNNRCYNIRIIWVLVFLLQTTHSLGWFFSREKVDSSKNLAPEISRDIDGEFSMVLFDSEEEVSLVEKAKDLATMSTCMQNAFQSVYARCSEIVADSELKPRLAWGLTDCFQKHTGRPPLPNCNSKSPMVDCLKNMDEIAHTDYLKFYLHIDIICHHLQSEAFKKQTERLVNDLKRSALYAEEKIENIEEKADRVLHTSENIQTSISSIDVQTQQLAQTSKHVEERVNDVLEHSQLVYEQSFKIAESQTELQNGQMKMNERIDEGMVMLNESASKLGEGLKRLRSETVEIQKEIGEVGDKMFKKMSSLQSKAEDIENMTETSLDKHKELLESQSAALDVLHTVTSFQSQALEENRGSLQQLISLGHTHQQELIQRQEQLKQTHNDLLESSKTMLAAQELFQSNQSTMFVALNNLSNLHKALLLESRVIKAVLVYSIFIFFLYMLTSTKETYNVRSRLFAGLCVTFLIEYAVLRYGNNIVQQVWITNIVRFIFMVLASCQLLYAGYTYRDYETLNHRMLETLVKKVNGMEESKELLCEDDDDYSDVDWTSWVDRDISDDELEDVDYSLPVDLVNTASPTTGGYNLRRRSRQ